MCETSESEFHTPFSRATAEFIDACGAAHTFDGCPRRGRTRTDDTGRIVDFCPVDAWARELVEVGAAVKHVRLLVADRLGQRQLERDLADPRNVPLRVALALLRREPVTVRHDRDQGVELTLTGQETLVAFGGSRGIGKSLAMAWLVGQLGGRVVDAYGFARPGADIEGLATQRGTLVIDQLGREYSKGDWAQVQIEEIVERRRKRERLTVLVANLNRDDFALRYGKFIDDRLNEDAAFVCCYGPSRRGA